MMEKKIVCMLAVLGLMAGGAMAIVVPDASFEDATTIGDNSWEYLSTTGGTGLNDIGQTPWNDRQTGYTWMGNNYPYGMYYPGVGHTGTQWIDINLGTVYQNLTGETYTDGEIYRLSVWACSDREDETLTLQLIDGDGDGSTALASSADLAITWQDPALNGGQWAWYQYSFDFEVGTADAGKTIGIQFVSGEDNDIYLDDVALTVVPEQMTLSLLGLGALLLRKRK